MNLRRLLLFGLGALCAGCATSPFPPVRTVPPGDDARAADWRSAVESATPDRMDVSGATVIHYRGRALTALSETRVDEPARRLTVVSVSPAGMTLFELESRDGVVERVALAPGLDSRGDPSKSIAKDVERVYFKRVPPAGASVVRRRDGFLFIENGPEGATEYLLGGSPPVLIEKRFRDRRGVSWRATYHAYREQDGWRIPGAISYWNRRYGYRIDVRLTTVTPEKEDRLP